MNKKSLLRIFEPFGSVSAITTRFKQRGALDNNANKSWALLTFETVGSASRALRAEHIVDDDDGKPHTLMVRPAAIEENLQKPTSVYAPSGKLEKIVKDHAAQEERQSKLGANRAGRGKRYRAAGQEASADVSVDKQTSTIRTKQVQELRAQLQGMLRYSVHNLWPALTWQIPSVYRQRAGRLGRVG